MFYVTAVQITANIKHAKHVFSYEFILPLQFERCQHADIAPQPGKSVKTE